MHSAVTAAVVTVVKLDTPVAKQQCIAQKSDAAAATDAAADDDDEDDEQRRRSFKITTLSYGSSCSSSSSLIILNYWFTHSCRDLHSRFACKLPSHTLAHTCTCTQQMCAWTELQA